MLDRGRFIYHSYNCFYEHYLQMCLTQAIVAVNLTTTDQPHGAPFHVFFHGFWGDAKFFFSTFSVGSITRSCIWDDLIVSTETYEWTKNVAVCYFVSFWLVQSRVYAIPIKPNPNVYLYGILSFNQNDHSFLEQNSSLTDYTLKWISSLIYGYEITGGTVKNHEAMALNTGQNGSSLRHKSLLVPALIRFWNPCV